MFNLFKKKTQSESIVERQKKVSSFSVKDIHNDFNSVADQIIAEAEKIIDESIYSEEELKAKRLISLGFTSSQPVINSSIEIEKKEQRAERLKKNKLEAEAAKYFSQKYPFNKFITLEKVNQLCEKYGLKLDWVDRYIGDVPEKNLSEIENFKLQPEDRAVCIQNYGGDGRFNSYYISQTDANKLKLKPPTEHGTLYLKNPKFYKSEFIQDDFYVQKPMIIAPPSNILEFNQTIKDGQIIELKDPIVIHPVFYEGLTGDRIFLIVTAWGDEASDPNVVNERMN